MIDDNNIQVADLCTLQFREPLEYEMYPEQVDMYCAKIANQELKVQVLVDSSLELAPPKIVCYNDKGYELIVADFVISETEVGTNIFYAEVTISKSSIAAIAENSIVYFSIESDDRVDIFATSVWYTINPAYTGDLKQITYSHSENDWNVQFNDSSFTLTVECGFIPEDNRDEQEVDDFVQQNMVNEITYGDEYEVIPLTYGDGIGIPNWLRIKLSRASLCDNFKVSKDNVDMPITRIQGAKMEKVKATENGLGIYKLDVQRTNNYLQ